MPPQKQYATPGDGRRNQTVQFVGRPCALSLPSRFRRLVGPQRSDGRWNVASHERPRCCRGCQETACTPFVVCRSGNRSCAGGNREADPCESGRTPARTLCFPLLGAPIPMPPRSPEPLAAAPPRTASTAPLQPAPPQNYRMPTARSCSPRFGLASCACVDWPASASTPQLSRAGTGLWLVSLVGFKVSFMVPCQGQRDQFSRTSEPDFFDYSGPCLRPPFGGRKTAASSSFYERFLKDQREKVGRYFRPAKFDQIPAAG